jgi:hypothetical protein
MMRTSEKRFIAITDPEILYYKALADAIPGFIQQMDNTHTHTHTHRAGKLAFYSPNVTVGPRHRRD